MVTDKITNINLFISPKLYIFMLFEEEKKCHHSCQTNQLRFYTFLVSGSESGHSRVTRDSYNYDPRGDESCRNFHNFHLENRSSVEHSNIATALLTNM